MWEGHGVPQRHSCPCCRLVRACMSPNGCLVTSSGHWGPMRHDISRRAFLAHMARASAALSLFPLAGGALCRGAAATTTRTASPLDATVLRRYRHAPSLGPRRIGDVVHAERTGMARQVTLDFRADLLAAQACLLQNGDGSPTAVCEYAEQEVLGAKVLVMVPFGFLPCEHGDDLSGPLGKSPEHRSCLLRLCFSCHLQGSI